MRRSFIVNCFLLFLLSYANETVPDGVLPKDKMEAVLWDVMRADEMVNQYALTDSTYLGNSKNVVLYQKVFQLHDLSKDQFQKSLQYYQQHPAQLQPIIDSLKAYSERKTLSPLSAQ